MPRITSHFYAGRELVQQALRARGMDPAAGWYDILERALNPELPDVVKMLLSLCPPAPTPKPVKANHPGIDRHRGNYRARCWLKGKVIFAREFHDLESAVAARAEFLATK